MDMGLIEQDQWGVEVAENACADALVTAAPGKTLAKAEQRWPLNAVDFSERAKRAPVS